jgi:hydrogenase-4 component F
MLILAAASFANFLLKAFSKVTVEEEKDRQTIRTHAEAGRAELKTAAEKADHDEIRLPNRYMVRSGMRVPAFFMLALAFALGVYFPDSLRDLLDAIILNSGMFKGSMYGYQNE